MPSTVHVVAAVVRNAAAQVLIQQRPPGKHQAGYWEFPGGKVHAGETSWDALVRELHEELGITAVAGQPLITLHHTYPQYRVRLEMWDIERWQGHAVPREHQPIQWLASDALSDQQLLPADAPVINALRLPHAHLVTPDMAGTAVGFLNSLTASVRTHQLRLVTLRQTACDDRDYRELADAAIGQLTPLGCGVLLHGNPQVRLSWIDKLGAAGFHLRATDHIAKRHRERCGRWLAMSCHDARQLRQAADIGVDFGVLGSVSKTAGHPDILPLGWQRFSALTAEVNYPVYAIGGMQPDDIASGRAAGAQGISAIRGLWNSQSSVN